MADEGLSIGRVAAETRCNIETIRFYERKGLLPAPARTQGGHRVYSAAMVGRLVFIRRCRELGFTMAEILELLSLVDRHEVSCERVKEIADLHLVDIRAKIADLKRMERTLVELAGRCSGDDVPECPMIESLFPP